MLEQVALQEFEMQGEVGRDCKCNVAVVICQLCFHCCVVSAAVLIIIE